MIINKLKFKQNFSSTKQSGFTIVEALVAIFILTVSVSSMLGVTASAATSARFANNQLTANYLLQEGIDYIRNSRDTIAFQNREDLLYGWDVFIAKYGGASKSMCFGVDGCDIRMENFSPSLLTSTDIISFPCTGEKCENLSLYNGTNPTFFYSHKIDSNNVLSNFSRTIKMTKINDDEVKITVTVNWVNGSLDKHESLEVYLLNWQK